MELNFKQMYLLNVQIKQQIQWIIRNFSQFIFVILFLCVRSQLKDADKTP